MMTHAFPTVTPRADSADDEVSVGGDPFLCQPEFDLLYVLSKNDLKKGLIPIPSGKLYLTRGALSCMSNVMPDSKSRTVCLLFQNKQCHEGSKCHQIHVHRSYWKQIEEMDFFSPMQHSTEAGGIEVMYRERGRPGPAKPFTVPGALIYVTKGSEAYFAEKARNGYAAEKEVCNYFHKKACNYRYNCNQIHVDVAVWKEFIDADKKGRPPQLQRPLPFSPMLPKISSAFLPPADAIPAVPSAPRLEPRLNDNFRSRQSSWSATDGNVSVLVEPRPPAHKVLLPPLPHAAARAEVPARATSPVAAFCGLPPFFRNGFGAPLLTFTDELWRPLERLVAGTASEVGVDVNSTFSDDPPEASLSPSAPSPAIPESAEPLDTVWVKYNGAEDKVLLSSPTSAIKDVADLRRAAFSMFTFPCGVVATDVEVHLRDQPLDMRLNLTKLNLYSDITFELKLKANRAGTQRT